MKAESVFFFLQLESNSLTSQKNCTAVQIQMMSTINDGSLRRWNPLGETVEHNDIISQNKLTILTNFKSSVLD